MPQVSEVNAGTQYQFSNDQGKVAASVTRVFRILKSTASEYTNIFSVCGVNIGDQHPSESGLYCASASAQYEGDSRMVVLATFTYKTTPVDDDSGGGGGGGGGGDRNAYSPEVRPPTYSVSVSLQEVPALSWDKMTNKNPGVQTPRNSAEEPYDNITKMAPVTTVVYKFFDNVSVAGLNVHAGKINGSDIRLMSLGNIGRHTVMFRGAQSSPTVETFQGVRYSGFENTFEFMYRPNVSQLDGNMVEVGWDMLVLQSGLSLITHTPLANPSQNNGGKNDFALPLKHDNNQVVIPASLADGIAVGSRQRAMISIPSGDGKFVQRPAGAAILLNEDGHALAVNATPIVNRYRVYEELDFQATFPPRFF
jgi:hypothetical protein